MLGLIMAIVDTSIVNVALTNMAIIGTLGRLDRRDRLGRDRLHPGQVIVMPLNGWLTARFGRRNFYAACIVIFTVSSFLCGTATSVWQLVFYRVIQGIGGGALQPTAQAILFESYPPDKRAGAMAIFGLGAMVGPAIGPTLGGYIVDNYSWPLIFFINIADRHRRVLDDAGVHPRSRLRQARRNRRSTGSDSAADRRRRLAAVRARTRPDRGLVLSRRRSSS
jgi:DHA2 family multidrug resistance protein